MATLLSESQRSCSSWRPDGYLPQELRPQCPSVGSVGHPFTCRPACKYNSKASGCKDGKLCTRCHMCAWQRASDKASMPAALTPDSLYARALDLTGHLTPDPPSVAHVGDNGSDGPSNGEQTPPQKAAAVYGLPSLDIADELRAKLDFLQCLETPKLATINEKEAKEAQPYYAPVPVPPPPAAYAGVPRTRAVRQETVPAPPGLELRQLDGGAAAKEGQIDEAQVGDLMPYGSYQVGDLSPDQDGAPAPPPPPPPPDAPPEIVISIGSVGHPKNCGAACRYARRKGGCREGAQCRQCHQCQWQRERTTEPEEVSQPLFSVGTQGHPHNCGQACKYVRRKGGCRNGSACLDCHQCMWRRQAKEDMDTAEGAPMSVEAVTTQPLYPIATARSADMPFEVAEQPQVACMPCMFMPGEGYTPSVGSIGHPFSCAGMGCKYNGKAKGCKDGRLCIRCHLCQWRRYQQGP